MTLTKDALINEVAKQNGYPRNQSVELVETLLEIIKSKLVSGEDVLISGFGKFCVRKKRERRGRNPATGEDMMLEARKVVTFKCSGQLRKKNQSTWGYLMDSPGFKTPAEDRCFEDYVPGSVHEFGLIRIEEEAIVAFGRRFDPQLFHIDPEGAKSTI